MCEFANTHSDFTKTDFAQTGSKKYWLGGDAALPGSNLRVECYVVPDLTLHMRCCTFLVLWLVMLAGGCGTIPADSSGKKQGDSKPAGNAAKKTQEKIIVTPSNSPYGVVIRVNTVSRFAVVSFASGNLPSNGTQVGAYRNGLKVGELKITGPQQGENIVADLVTGEAQTGDEIRAN